MIRYGFILVFVILSLISSCSGPRNPYSQTDITLPELKYHVEILASDSLEGRAPGTEGGLKAAEYIAGEFRYYSLQPGGANGFYQDFPVITGVTADSGNRLMIGNEILAIGKDFIPLAFSADTTVEGPVVFAGYGITSAEAMYDDYAGIDVKEKIVMVMRYSPDGDDPKSVFKNAMPSRRKAAVAAEKGAKGLLVVTGPADGDDELIPLQYDNTLGNYGIPVFSVSRNAAEKILHTVNKKLADLQSGINKTRKPNSFSVPTTAILQSRIVYDRKTTSNIIGLIEGSDADLKKEIIVLGAHYDHLGWGGPNSAYRGKPAIHNGADDNASGTAAILELAQKLSSVRSELKRSVLIIAFGAEEMGLLGSKYFLDHPTIDTRQIITMVNLDMIGRLNENKLLVYGMGTSPGFRNIITDMNNEYQFDLALRDEGSGPSDVAEFYRKDIPVMYFFTNTHEDYHKPSDDADKINYSGQEKITKMVFDVIIRIANAEEKPKFTKAKEDAAARPSGFRVTLGIVPNMAESGNGLKVDGVNPGGAGDKAGIRKGDNIIKFGDRVIKNIYDYTYALGDHKPGDAVDIIVIRDGKEVQLKAVMQKSKRRD